MGVLHQDGSVLLVVFAYGQLLVGAFEVPGAADEAVGRRGRGGELEKLKARVDDCVCAVQGHLFQGAAGGVEVAAFEVVNGSNLVLLFDTEPNAGDDVLGQSGGARSQSEPLVGGFLLGGLPDGLADVAFLLAPHFASGLGVDLAVAGHEARGSQR